MSFFSLSTQLLDALRASCTSYFPVNLLCCSGGLKNILYCVGLGYGLSMTYNGISTPLNFGHSLSADIFSQSTRTQIALIGSILYASHGIRTFLFLLRRQNFFGLFGRTGYESRLKDVADRSAKMPFFVKAIITTFVSLIMGTYTIPLQLAYGQAGEAASVDATSSAVPSLSLLAVSAVGLLIETVVDEQKQAFKKKNPNMPMMTGLFSKIRHANYFGEILFHFGLFGLVLDLIEFLVLW